MIRACLAACALLLAGCGGAEAPQADEQSAANDAAVAPAPAADAPAPATASGPPVLSAEGLGPLRIGMTRAEAEATAWGPDSDPQAVGGAEPERCDEFRFAKGPPGVMAMVEEGRLTRISLLSEATLDTDRGLGPGDTAAAVKAAYGARARTEPHKYVEAPAAYITVWEKGGGGPAPYVEDPAARGIVYEIGADGKVAAVHAGGPSVQYVEGCA